MYGVLIDLKEPVDGADTSETRLSRGEARVIRCRDGTRHRCRLWCQSLLAFRGRAITAALPFAMPTEPLSDPPDVPAYMGAPVNHSIWSTSSSRVTHSPVSLLVCTISSFGKLSRSRSRCNTATCQGAATTLSRTRTVSPRRMVSGRSSLGSICVTMKAVLCMRS